MIIRARWGRLEWAPWCPGSPRVSSNRPAGDESAQNGNCILFLLPAILSVVKRWNESGGILIFITIVAPVGR